MRSSSVSTTFLFGAGASFGSGPCHPYPPPLGKDLFEALRLQGGVASRVSADLVAAFKDDFEAGMDRFWAERHGDLAELQRDMARFLSMFEPEEGNYYLDLIRIMGHKRKYVMVTTNYDLLIEIAASGAGMSTNYRGLPVEKNGVSLLKIHGSCNFLPDMGGGRFENLQVILSNKQSAILEAPLKFATSAAEVVKFCNTNDFAAPAIAIYSPEKQVLHCPGFVKQQQEQWRTAAREASRIYIIGMRVHEVDDHIWGEIAKAKGEVYYVGRQPDTFSDWAKAVGLKKAYVIARSFQDALPHIAKTHGHSFGVETRSSR